MDIIKKYLRNKIVINQIEKIFLILILFLFFTGCIQTGISWGDAPDFTLKTIDNENFNLSKQIGKVVVLDFMYVYCRPCQMQMSELKTLYDQFKNEIILISISVWWAEDSKADLIEFRDYYNAEWFFALDTTAQDAATKYNAISVPKIIVINKNGDIEYTHTGWTSSDDLIKEINKII